ncbi:ABC transporter ATPase component [compost metagenome]
MKRQAEAQSNRKPVDSTPKASSQGSAAISNSATDNSSKSSSVGTKLKKLSFKEQKEWDEIEGRIAALEQRGLDIKQELEASSSQFEQVQKLYDEAQQNQEQLDAAMERWSELSELVEEIERNKL